MKPVQMQWTANAAIMAARCESYRCITVPRSRGIMYIRTASN